VRGVDGGVGGPVRRQRDGVDRQVAPRKILFERDIGRRMDGEAAVAGRALAFGARQRVFLARLGMQEHREVAAHRQEALGHHLFGRGADHDPVAIAAGPAQQRIADRAADEKGLHGPEV
jgi:hypothetical protein